MPYTAAPRLQGKLPPQSWLKKTTELIVQGANDYIIAVKGNQPRLLAQLKTITKQQKPCDRVIDIEKTRGRITCRIVELFADIPAIDSSWQGLRSFVQVERIGIRQGKPYQQRVRPRFDRTRQQQESHTG